MKTILILIFFVAFSAHAEFAAIGSYHLSDPDKFSTPDPEQVSGKAGFALGVLDYIPLVPTLNVRTGLEWEELKLKDTNSGATSVVNWENLLLPIGVQWEAPITGLYFFGGAIFALNIRRPNNTPGWADTRLDLGIGYSVIDFGPAKLAVELEYMMGLANLSLNPDDTLKTNALAANLVVRF